MAYVIITSRTSHSEIWHRWYAWRPCGAGWLRYVYRKRVFTPGGLHWVYRTSAEHVKALLTESDDRTDTWGGFWSPVGMTVTITETTHHEPNI